MEKKLLIQANNIKVKIKYELEETNIQMLYKSTTNYC